jgi:hypothetical protein
VAKHRKLPRRGLRIREKNDLGAKNGLETFSLPEESGWQTGKRTCIPMEWDENQEKAHAGRGQEIEWEISV